MNKVHHPHSAPDTARTLPSLRLAWLLAGSLTLLVSACGGGDASSTQPPAAADNKSALSASKPGELLAYVKLKLKQREQQRGAAADVVFVTGGTLIGTTTGTADAPAIVEANRSGTVVQEQGVDEDDLLKTDGQTLYAVVPPLAGVQYIAKPSIELRTWRRTGSGQATPAGALAVLDDKDSTVEARGMLLAAAAQRAAVIGESQSQYACLAIGICPTVDLMPGSPPSLPPAVHVDLLDVANSAAPARLQRWRIDGRLVGTRLIGSKLYLVTQHAPLLAVDTLPATTKPEERDAALARLTVAEVLPTIRVDGGRAQPLLQDTDCFVQPANAAAGIEITAFTVVDLATPTLTRTSRCFAGGSEALYMSTESLYVATTRYAYTAAVSSLLRMPGGMTTDIHKFALSGNALAGPAIDYRGSGEVQGHLGWDVQRKSYRLSEWKGDLRVLSFTGETGWGIVTSLGNSGDPGELHLPPASPATLTVLRERSSDKSLQVVSTLPNAKRPQAIGKPDEQLYGVRFLGDRAYAVTFRRTDPLYVLDLSNPADPQAVGELQFTGFSDYLFPLADGLLLGVGKEASEDGRISGVKVALFDVANPAQPRQTASLSFGAGRSQSGLDFSSHGIDLFTRNGVVRAALPLLLLTEPEGLAPERGLQRLEINLAAKTLVSKPLLKAEATPTGAWPNLAADRSVQIEDTLYYFADGALTSWDWSATPL